MTTLTVSSKYQIVIPARMRESLGIRPGEKLHAIEYRESPATLLVPTVSLYEVFKRVCQQRDEEAALRAVAMMEQGRVVDLDQVTALEARN